MRSRSYGDSHGDSHGCPAASGASGAGGSRWRTLPAPLRVPGSAELPPLRSAPIRALRPTIPLPVAAVGRRAHGPTDGWPRWSLPAPTRARARPQQRTTHAHARTHSRTNARTQVTPGSHAARHARTHARTHARAHTNARTRARAGHAGLRRRQAGLRGAALPTPPHPPPASTPALPYPPTEPPRLCPPPPLSINIPVYSFVGFVLSISVSIPN